MKDYSGRMETPNRIILPVVDILPSNPMIAEIVYFNQKPKEGLMIYNGEGWVSLYATRNNYWETHIAEKDQTVFNLVQEYDCDGHSLVVYKDGVRLDAADIVEIGRNIVGYRGKDEAEEDIEIYGGEVFQFQIFNIRQTEIFDVKSFNRRVGLSHV